MNCDRFDQGFSHYFLTNVLGVDLMAAMRKLLTMLNAMSYAGPRRDGARANRPTSSEEGMDHMSGQPGRVRAVTL
ncbi:MAG: hypothetical protein ABI604_08260 [Nitrospirota bacterium]